MDVRFVLFLLFLMTSCMPSAQVSKANLESGGTTSGTSGGSNGTTTGPTVVTQWNYLGALSKTITINVSNLNNSYVVGTDLESFLSTSTNFAEDYCLISRYSISGFTHELRTRIVPISYYDFVAKRTVKIFRVDFNDTTNSKLSCVVSTPSPIAVKTLDPNGVHVLDTAPTLAARTTFDPAIICPLCTSVLSASKMFVVKRTLTDLQEVALSQVDIRALSLSIDPNNNINSNIGTCSQTECASRGYDCCLDNQCVTDGAPRASASSQYPSELLAAEQERLSNPLAFLNYPHLFYICGSSVPTSTGGSSGGGSYVQGLTQLKKDYYCIEHMKKFKTGETFHQDVLNGTDFFPDKPGTTDIPNVLSSLYPLDIECRRNDALLPILNPEMKFQKVTERLYQNCGCAKTTLSEMIQYCPAYDYTVNYFETSGLPNRIDCYTPPTGGNQIPLQQTVSVNSRTAPHRYFRICGDEFGSSAPCLTGNNQEGDVFEYQDEGYILPIQDKFGMNSILGQMKVTLDKAVPAKTVAVELDQVYVISTISGFYSPCPTCNKDSWFNSFSAYPTTAYGTGIQAVGHSTSRDFFDNNATGGNYEDTIFGRACWIPPTMIPFTHSPSGSVQTQRLTRLKTQAALFANGYQRDWYGFNKGALIGSFDGVSWFAVGKGRIVKSTTKKLFLAINAPFADLASPTLQVVNVQAYDGTTQAAQLDYDPSLHLSHSYQNEAGNCQANHMCATDTDCVTRLGWEYMCASVQDLKTQWPQFDADAKEKAGVSDVLTIDQVLNQKRFPSTSTKRCVYRGAGSLCIPNSGIVTDFNKRKTLTCAPNFYCANINSGTGFNSKVSRYASNLEEIPVNRNHYYGKDANVLGRPLSYIASSLTGALDVDVRASLTQNMLLYQSTASAYTGICLPGKALPETANQATLYNPYEQHKAADSLGRTDFISQIGGCNSGLFSNYRYSSCPVFHSSGDYEFLISAYSPTNYQIRARNQNSCGLDSLLTGTALTGTADSLLASSPFKAIQSKTLSLQTVVEPTMARDACLRRAGQVCHTDLDCGPNKRHADETENYMLDYFGNEAEKKYYNEYLVCGQANAKPSPLDTVAYKDFEMNKNRCCREIGSDISTHTAYVPLLLNPNLLTPAVPTSLEYDPISYGLNMSGAPGIAPNDQYRYSRLATVEGLGTASRPILSAFQDRVGANLSFAQGANVMTPNQWKTLGEANSETCCGGGWIRKFSDGGNDWTRRDRVYMDVKNFACINSRNPLLTHPEDFTSLYTNTADVIALVNQDQGDYCKDAIGVKGACAQFSIPNDSNDFPPVNNPMVAPGGPGDTGHYKTYGSDFVTYQDYYFYPRSTDSNIAIIIDNTVTTERRNISVRLPSFITRSWDTVINSLADGAATRWAGGARVHMYNVDDETGNADACTKKTSLLTSLNSPTVTGSGLCTFAGDGAHCCYAFDSITRTVKVVPAFDGTFGPAATTKKMGVKFINAMTAGSYGTMNRTAPKSNTYYLKRLGLFELTGIPQITYKPIACNDNSDRLVPGLFKKGSVSDMRLAAHFNQDDYAYQGTDPTTGQISRYTNVHGLSTEPVFSENDFKCCSPLGFKTNSQSKCCSGYGRVAPNGSTVTCGIPAGTDLMVYLNRFVSNEGRGSDQPGGGLVDADFNTLTGEPLITTTVSQKITALGNAYCENMKVRQGGAFGSFGLEPYGSDTNDNEQIFGIVDSTRDETAGSGSGPGAGYTAFMGGFRWNHHLYCDD